MAGKAGTEKSRTEHASLGDLFFYRRAPEVPPAEPAPRGLVSTSLFKFAGAYRELAKYARGVALLAAAVRVLLPGFTLRVYCDASVDPRTLRAAGAGADADAIEAALGAVAAGGGAVVWFRSASATDGAAGHKDLFGTLVRFTPLFHPEALPAWCGGPPDGTVVFVTDADFADYAVERSMVALAGWLSEQGGERGVELATLSSGASAAPRHVPTAGLPPFIANCVAARVRFPLPWFSDFLRDSSAPEKGSLAERYAADVRDPRVRNFTFEKRRMAMQTSRFPFGIDEFFLSAVLKARAVARREAAPWLFLIVPGLDIAVRRALNALSAAEERGAAGGKAARERLACAAANVAGVGAPPPQGWLDAATRDWPGAAAGRGGAWDRGGGALRFFDATVAEPLARDVREFWAAFVDALAAGAVPSSSPEELDYALQGAAVAAALAPSLAGSLVFDVGAGDARRRAPPQPYAEDLDARLMAIRVTPLRAAPPAAGGGAAAAVAVLLDDEGAAELRRPPPAAAAAGGSGGGGGGGGAAAVDIAPDDRKRRREEELPEGWALKASSSRRGETYFLHVATGRTTWERPVK